MRHGLSSLQSPPKEGGPDGLFTQSPQKFEGDFILDNYKTAPMTAGDRTGYQISNEKVRDYKESLKKDKKGLLMSNQKADQSQNKDVMNKLLEMDQ